MLSSPPPPPPAFPPAASPLWFLWGSRGISVTEVWVLAPRLSPACSARYDWLTNSPFRDEEFDSLDVKRRQIGAGVSLLPSWSPTRHSAAVFDPTNENWFRGEMATNFASHPPLTLTSISFHASSVTQRGEVGSEIVSFLFSV